MKKFKILILLCIAFIITCSTNFDFDSRTITTNAKEFNEGNKDTVSYRELTMASALSYVDVPLKCRSIDGTLKANCKFSDYSDLVGHINAKMNLDNYATVDEMDGWSIVDYESKSTGIFPPSLLNRLFYAFTLEKGDNIIIVYRGTDFMDAFEWIQDVVGGITSISPQESFAEEYALKIAQKYSDKHIYITGHSLGGYLTQIGASALEKAIQNGINGRTDWDGWNLLNRYDINKYTDNGSFAKYKNIKFEQAVYFDGIGMNVFSSSMLGEPNYKQDKKIEVLKKLGNSISTKGDSKLIGYNTKGDLVSTLGVHYGERREVYASLDTISSYKRLFNTLNFNVTSAQKADNVSKLLKFEQWIFDAIANTKLTKINVREIYQQYDVGSNIASVVLAHKIDSLMCSLDSTNQNEIKVKITEKNILNSIPYISDMISKNVSNEIYTNKPITLIATTFNACARKYVWHICDLNGENCVDYENSESNEYTFTNVNTKKLISVTAYYDDTYTKSKLEKSIVNDNAVYEYADNNNFTNKASNSTSGSIKVIYDTIKPECSFETESPFAINRVCEKRGFLGICKKWRNATKTAKFTCYDGGSGFTNNSYDKKFELTNNRKLLLFPLLEITKVVPSLKDDTLLYEINLERVAESSKETKLQFNGKIMDRAGNSFVFNGPASISIINN